MRISDWSSDVCSSDLSGLRLLESTRNSVALLQSKFMRFEHTLHALEVPADPAGETARAFAKASLRRDREIGEEGGAAREQRVGLGTMLGRPAVQIVAGGLVGALECAAIAHIIDDRASPAFFGNLKLDRKSTRLNSSH